MPGTGRARGTTGDAALNESTIIKSMDLPADLGRDWVWYPDLNVVVLRTGLDCDGQKAALDDLYETWRRSHLTVVESA